MNCTARRKKLVLFLCCGVTGLAAAVHADEAAAQSEPLRVDPVLLGLPPVQPAEKERAVSDSGSANKEGAAPAAAGTAQVKPVDAAAVDAKPVAPLDAAPTPDVPQRAVVAPDAAAAPAGSTAPAPVTSPSVRMPEVPADQGSTAMAPESQTRVAPADAAPASAQQSEQLPAATPAPVPAPAAPRSAVAAPAPEQRRETSPARPPAAAGAASTSRTDTLSLAPLRVDPALLGLPPVVPTTQLAGRGDATATPQVSPPRTTAATQPAGTAPLGELADADAAASADTGPALRLRSAKKLQPLPKDSNVPRPVFLSALRVNGEINQEVLAEGEAELRKVGTVVNADGMTYWPLDDEVEAVGNVRVEQDEDVITGPKARLRLEERVGYFEEPVYVLKHQSLLGEQKESEREASDNYLGQLSTSIWSSGFASPTTMNLAPGQTRAEEKIKLTTTTQTRGEAERMNFEGENHYRLLNNTFTTCPVGNNDWYARSSEMTLDYDTDVGEGKNATLYFKDVPILYSPWLSFSLNNERKSGFLRPSFGTSSDNGFEYEQPYYWNIAPNMDATLTPRLMSKRGVQFSNEFRYLNTAMGGAYRGELNLEYLPDDQLRDNRNRYGIAWVHNQTTNNGFTGLINYNRVSDDDYYTDLSSDITRTSQTQLLQQAQLTYSGGGWWNSTINFQQYQTLQSDEDNPVLEQYRMLPQLTFNARKPDFGLFDLTFLGQYTNFTIDKREQYGSIYPDGKRTLLYPQIALPYVTPGWYVTPKFGVNYRSYALSGQASGVPGSQSVTLPIFSLDSGMTFERSSNWFGRNYTQTLEPRLYYLNIPYRDQSQIPLFDTALADFNFAQIFSENEFSGWDRVNNANQLTAGLTTRLIEPDTGNEIMRAMIGQRYYFSRNRVALSGTVVEDDGSKWERSDFLAGFNGQILPKVYLDTALQFNVDDQLAQRYSVGVRYQPEAGKALNLAYRYNRDTSSPVNQVDVSGQWPLFGHWYGVGRVNYSFKDDSTVLSTGGGGRIIQSLAGLEYSGDCWVLRGVIRRQAVTSTEASTSFFVQLELSGLGRIGSNPLSLLQRSVQGYSSIADSTAESLFGD